MSTTGFNVNIDTKRARQELDLLKDTYRRLRDELMREGMGAKGAARLATEGVQQGIVDKKALQTGGRGQRGPRKVLELAKKESGLLPTQIASMAAGEVEAEDAAENRATTGEMRQTAQERGQIEKDLTTTIKQQKENLRAASRQYQSEQKAINAATRADIQAEVKVQNQATAEVNKYNAARQRAADSINKQLNASRQMRQLEKDLGHNAGINTVQVIKQRQALEQLLLTKERNIVGGRRLRKELQAEIAQLRLMQPEVEKYNQKMRFMTGASVGAQKGIRNVGAAAQGGMLAMSAMNGDVLGLAFSLIFLQFAANIPVALGFGAVALAGALAFKGIKKVLDERREVEKLGNAFYIVTRSTQSMGLATQKAESITKGLGLATKTQEEADKALVATQQNLRHNGIEPTSEALRVALNAFLIAKAGGDEYEAALESTLQSTLAFADGGIPKLGSVAMTMEEMNSRGAVALELLTEKMEAMDIPIGLLIKQSQKAGVDIPKTFEGWTTDSTESMREFLENLSKQGKSLDLWTARRVDNWVNETAKMTNTSEDSSERIDKSFEGIAQSGADNLGANSKSDLAWMTFKAKMDDVIATTGRDRT